MAVTRFIQYCNKYLAQDNPGQILTARAPRNMSQLRSQVSCEDIARYFYNMELLLAKKNISAVRVEDCFASYTTALSHTSRSVSHDQQVVFADETGWSGFYESPLKGTKCVSQQQYRQDVMRITSDVRDHITLLYGVVALLDADGLVTSTHRLLPMFVYSRKYVSTRLANSQLDPDNILSKNPNVLMSGTAAKFLGKTGPALLPRIARFPRLVAASASGNVNSVIVFNYVKDHVFPLLRQLGVTKDKLCLFNWDRHASHTSKEILDLFATENSIVSFYPGHSTEILQLQDLEEFQKLKTAGRKDISAWNVFLNSRGKSAHIEDFPFIIQHAYDEATKPSVTKLGLKKTGLFPFDPDSVIRKRPAPKGHTTVPTYAVFKAQFEREKKEKKKGGKSNSPAAAIADDELELFGSFSDSDAEDQPDNGSGEDEEMFYLVGSDPTSNRSPPTKCICTLERKSDGCQVGLEVQPLRFTRPRPPQEVYGLAG